MQLCYPDYQNSIVNLAAFAQRYFGLESRHAPLQGLEPRLLHRRKKLCIMLFDGLGCKALGDHLPPQSFLRRRMQGEISSVFPPTTTASTISMMTGLLPMEHGWLGWNLYFHQLDRIVDLFPNTMHVDGEKLPAPYPVAGRHMPYETIMERIEKKGEAGAHWLAPFSREDPVERHEELYPRLKEILQRDESTYVYTYWPEPDALMHDKGCKSAAVGEYIRSIDKQVEALSRELSDTLLIITADHGHTDVRYKLLCDCPELMHMLVRPISMEARAAVFFVKDEYKSAFPQAFHAAFGGEDFLLLSKSQVLEKKLFGDGIPHPEFEGFLGDYMAISISDMALLQDGRATRYLSHHAGLTPDEMRIPLIVVDKE